MSRIHLSVIALAVFAAHCGQSSDSNRPLAGTVGGSAFSVVGSRTTNADGNVVLTFVNVPASCQAAVVPSDGQIIVEVTLPKTMLAAGSYSIGRDGVMMGVTKMTKSGAAPLTFEAVGLTSGTLNVQKVDGEVTGSLSASNDRISLAGSFHAPVCP